MFFIFSLLGPGRPTEKETPPSAPAKRKQPIVSKDVRLDEVGHFPIFVDKKNADRCQLPGCDGKSFIRCHKCEVYLCVKRDQNCYIQYHTL